MALPQTREEFKQFCLRKLGFPVNSLNIEVTQVEDRIDEALRYFQLNHYNGSEQFYLSIQVTSQVKSLKYFTMPAGIIGVTRVFDIGSTTTNALLTAQFALMSDIVWQTVRGQQGIMDYSLLMSYRSLVNDLIEGKKMIRFNMMQKKVMLDMNWSNIPEGAFVVFECTKALDPIEYPDVWTDPWLTEYATAVLKKQYGENLKKYTGVQLPGGITLDGQTLWNEGDADIRRLQDAVQSDYQLPPDFMMG